MLGVRILLAWFHDFTRLGIRPSTYFVYCRRLCSRPSNCRSDTKQPEARILRKGLLLKALHMTVSDVANWPQAIWGLERPHTLMPSHPVEMQPDAFSCEPLKLRTCKQLEVLIGKLRTVDLRRNLCLCHHPGLLVYMSVACSYSRLLFRSISLHPPILILSLFWFSSFNCRVAYYWPCASASCGNLSDLPGIWGKRVVLAQGRKRLDAIQQQFQAAFLSSLHFKAFDILGALIWGLNGSKRRVWITRLIRGCRQRL